MAADIHCQPTRCGSLDEILDSVAEEIDVIFLAGQSNQDGRAVSADARTALETYYDSNPTDKLIWYKQAVRNSLNSGASGGTEPSDSWTLNGEIYYVGINGGDRANTTSQSIGQFSDGTAGAGTYWYGPEADLAYLHSQDFPNKKLFIIKCGVGSSKIASWDFGSQGNGSLWKWCMETVHDPAVAALQAKNKTLNFLGASWVQGEADANATDAPNYQTRLTTAMNAFNTDLFAVPPKIIVQGLSSAYNGNTNGDTIETAQKAVATAISNVVYLEADGTDGGTAYSLKSDNVHYDNDGYEDMAADHWALWNEFDPASLGSDLVVWYDPTDETTITDASGAVSQLDDLSGNNYHATQVNADKPQTGTRTLNGENCLDFDGTEAMDIPNLTSNMPYEDLALFALYIPDSTATNVLVFGNNGSSNGRFYKWNQAIQYGSTKRERSSRTSGSGLIFYSRTGGTGSVTQSFQFNNDSISSGSTTRSTPNSTFALGAYGTGSSNQLDGALCGLMIIKNPTTEKINNIGNWYATKSGLTWGDQ